MTFWTTTAVVVVWTIIISSAVVVKAHRPLTTRPSCGDDYNSSSRALRVPDPTLSWAFRHYFDCRNRALWMSFQSPSVNFPFYVGVGVPTLERFAEIRADALIMGPGLPALSQDAIDRLPESIRTDPIWTAVDGNIGAYFHQSPQDQSTCDHLGTVMQEASSIVDGRCDFYEPFSQTHSWRVLDADNNIIPNQNATYHVAVFLQQDVSAKIGVALGTWVEDFRTPYDIDTPDCERDLSDFSEKQGSLAECFPVVTCTDNLTTVVGCDDEPSSTVVCARGEVCADGTDNCVVDGVAYQAPMFGSCGGERCPAAVQAWEEINMQMHSGMMNFEYSGNADVDFARQMIPHHLGAVDMCRVLLQDLTCTETSDIDNLEGLVHFCSHVENDQEIEVGGLRQWLEEKGLAETAPCPTAQTRSSTMMPESCGLTDTPSASAFINLNQKMMEFMAIEYSCDHSVDFVRMMMPHHASAVEMCEILLETTKDSYLLGLCGNITLTQRAEIAWMYDWLTGRDLEISAPCGECDYETLVMEKPCEDLLSTSSFCHGLDFSQDGYCKCDSTLAAATFSCDSVDYVDGVGLFQPNELCRRSCGQCLDESRPIWPPRCRHDDSSHTTEHNNNGMMDDNESTTGSSASFFGAFSATLAASNLLGILLVCWLY